MTSLHVTLIVFACLFAAIWVGWFVQRWLPEAHRNEATKDTVKLGMGLVATMVAILLGLLISSANQSYDSTRKHVVAMAAKIGVFDRVLGAYGEEARPIRKQFHTLMQEAIPQIWSTGSETTQEVDVRSGNEVFHALHELRPTNEAQADLKRLAISLAVEFAEIRLVLAVESVPSISRPLLILVVSWLVVLFVSFSAMAPPNSTAMIALLVSSFSVAGALLLVLELDHPFQGMLMISSDEIRTALAAFVE